MPKSKKTRNYDLGQVIGGIIFISLLLGLVLFGMFYETGSQFDSSFFEDVSNAIQWKQD